MDNKWQIIDYKLQYQPEATTTFIKENATESIKQSPEYTITLLIFLHIKLLYTGKYSPRFICPYRPLCQWANLRLSKFNF